MDSLLASSSGCIGALQIETGQVLKPNTRYFAGYGCDSFLMPLRSSLKAGDTFEIWRTLEPKEITMTMPDGGLFYDGDNSFYDEFKWNAVMEGTPRRYLKITFNGLDFQSVEYTEQGSIIAAEGRSKSFTESGDFVVPRGVTELIVTVVGGGGAGGGGGASAYERYQNGLAQCGSGAGGGAAVVGARIAVTEGEVIPLTVGSGGICPKGGSVNVHNGSAAGADGANGGEGGSSSFGDYIIVSGGKGGLAGTARGHVNDTYSVPARSGGDGGVVIKNITNGIEFNGGGGGASSLATAMVSQLEQVQADAGESVGDYVGSPPSAISTSIVAQKSTSGGGGASARGNGDEDYGGGGSGGIEYTGNSQALNGTAYGGIGGAGGNGVVYIEMVRA